MLNFTILPIRASWLCQGAFFMVCRACATAGRCKSLYPTDGETTCVGRKCRRRYVSFPHRNCCLDEVSRRLEQIERPRRSVKEEFLQRVSNHSTGFLNRPTTR